MSKPKRHHFVPAAYLARFGKNRQVLMRRRGRPKLIPANVINVAVESGFYETTDDVGQGSVEELLSQAEGHAMQVITEIDRTESVPLLASRATLAAFMALQMNRTPEHRERILFPLAVAKYAGDRPIDAELMRKFLQEKHLGFAPRDSEVQGALDFTHYTLNELGVTKQDAIELMLALVPEVARALLTLHWSLEVARKPRLITSDTPVVLWRRPSARDRFEGFGINGAEEIRFPLDPGKQLMLTPQPRPAIAKIEPDRVRQCNAELALACHRVVVGHPDRPRQLAELRLPKVRPVLRFNVGPGYRSRPDGSMEYTGEILHMWVQRR